MKFHQSVEHTCRLTGKLHPTLLIKVRVELLHCFFGLLCRPEGSTTSVRGINYPEYAKSGESMGSHRAQRIATMGASVRSASGVKLRSSLSRSVDSRATTVSRASGPLDGSFMEGPGHSPAPASPAPPANTGNVTNTD